MVMEEEVVLRGRKVGLTTLFDPGVYYQTWKWAGLGWAKGCVGLGCWIGFGILGFVNYKGSICL